MTACTSRTIMAAVAACTGMVLGALIGVLALEELRRAGR